MRKQITRTGIVIGFIFALAACDGSVKWPGFETAETDTGAQTDNGSPTEIVPIEDAGDTTLPSEDLQTDTPPPTIPVDENPAPDTPPTDIDDTPPPDPNGPADTPEGAETPTDETGEEENTLGDVPSQDAPVTPDETDDQAPQEEAEDGETSQSEGEGGQAGDEAEVPEAEDTNAQAPEEPVAEPAPPVEQPAAPPVAPAFSYHEPGHLLAGSGTGSPDRTVYAPDMVFPILTARAFPQSMVWRFGGGIGGGDECDARNYEYPWQDNFCEKRSRRNGTPSCPVERVHLGQDIRVGDAAGCNAMRREYRNNARGIARYRVVAAEDGIISNITRYTVTLRAGPRIYRYLHMNMRALQVSIGDTVSAGQHLGYVSKDFGGTPTTFHLHFEILVNTPDGGWEHVPPYTSLVASYARREQGPGEEIPRQVGVASTGPPIPDGFIITE